MDGSTSIGHNWRQNLCKFSKCLLYANRFFVEENVRNWHPRTHGSRNYLQSFYLAALIHKCRKKNQYPYAEIRNFIGNKRTRSF